MLPGKRYIFVSTRGDKNLMESMEVCKIVLKMSNISGGYGITANYIATIHECRDALDHFIRDMTMNGCNIDL